MKNTAAFALGRHEAVDERVGHELEENYGELVESREDGHRAVQGVILGLVLGAFLWAVILTAFGVIKL